MVKFLIIRFSSIGDIVLTTPVIRCLKRQVDNAEIHFLTKKQFLPVIQGNPYIDKIHILKENFQELVTDLEKEDFQYIIDLHHNLRSLRIKNRLKILSFSFNKLNIKKWFLVNFKFDLLPDIHIVDRYFKTVKIFDVVNDNNGLDYFIPSNEEINIYEISPQLLTGYVVVAVGAKHFTKQVPDDILIDLCNNINKPVLLLGGKEDFEKAENIKVKCRNLVINLCGKYSINQSASLVKQASLIITPDTGLMHIASAFKKKIISVWGNTVPKFGMFPYLPDPDSKMFEVNGLSCRPCSKIGYEKCPHGHFKCMKEHDVKAINEYIQKLLKN